MQVFDILNQLKSTDSTLEKEAILKKNIDNETLKECFRLAYTKQVNFFVRKFNNYQEHPVPMTLSHALNEALVMLASRRVTGNAAVDLLNDLYCRLDMLDSIVFKKVILGDLECGTSTAIANKVWKGLIPEQPQHLCQSFSKDKVDKYIDFKPGALAQLKADGARAFCDIQSTKIELLSRAGNEYQGLTRIHNALKKINVEAVIDGELTFVPVKQHVVEAPTKLGTLDFLFTTEPEVTEQVVEQNVADRSTGNGIATKALKGTISDEEQYQLVYNVWDITPRDVYYGHEECKMSYVNRLDWIRKIVAEINDPCIQLIETTEVHSYDEAQQVYQKYIDLGLEGIILKNKNGNWKDGRSNHQIKFKVVEPVDMKIIDVYPHSKQPHKLGGITVVDASGLIKVDCGSGFKDKDSKKVGGKKVYIPLDERHEYDRELLMSISDELIGTIVEVETNGVVKDKKTGELSLFLPIFKKRRYDKNQPNDIRDIFDMSKFGH